ncbi:MAG: ribonuclease inhibitor, partial [Runella slithyformis]
MLTFILLQAADWATFLGRFHPVLVHLPIGFLLLAGLLEIGRLLGKVDAKSSTVSFILFWSAVGATFACGAGYLLSLGGGYEAELLEKHKWQGIWVAVAAWVAWVAKSDLFTDKIPFGS